MIRTEALTKYFGRRCAVRDFEVEIDPRRIVGFLGLNGAGKTTTLRMLAGLLAPSEGRVWIDDQDLAGPTGHRTRARIGFLPDRPPVHEDMAVADFVRFAGRLRGASVSAARVDEVLERTALTEVRAETIAHLSHGYRQRVGLAQAIVHDPALVILDEPTSGLDPRQIVQMRALVKGLGERHTVLLSSHNLHEVSETCDEILLIDEGRLAARGSPRELEERLGGTARLQLTVVGPMSEVEASVERLKAAGVGEVQLRASVEEGVHQLSVATTRLPEDVAGAAFEAGLRIRRLTDAEGDLERLFARLTGKAQA